jgi:uncharacterized protein with ParB-like and HNH nuclease domain
MKLLYSIKEVFSTDGYLKEESKKCFNIPLYQRGYKWTDNEVVKLLDDINNFSPTDDKFYCLQNITIVPSKDKYNVVDGQQRLTTLTILLSYLGEAELVANKIRFPENSIRKETNDFINKIIVNHENGITNREWGDFILEYPNYDHQDVFHLFWAFNTINNWFTGKGTEFSKADFLSKLLSNVKLIVNKIETQSDEEEIFGNLNSKRIPLDGADLFRAILITRVAREEYNKELKIKDVIDLNEKRIKIGWEFDQINNWWSKDSVKKYFKNFISIKSEKSGKDLKLFDSVKHPINLLLYLFAESKDKSSLSLELIEGYNNKARSLYHEILNLHNTLKDWFEDRIIYHLLGFIFSQTKTNFTTIWKKWLSVKTRDEFIGYLKTTIQNIILKDDTIVNYANANIDWYHDESVLLVQILILMDVIASLDESQSFMPPDYFSKSLNDIEHIFPQSPEDVKEKKEFVEFLNKRNDNKPFDLTNYDKMIEVDEYKQKLESFIQNHISSIKTNSIGNLVLLYYRLNRSIGRSSYAKKRTRVIDYFNSGNYIQPHTFRVFVRYFSDGQNDTRELEHWTNDDIEANANAIDNKLKEFFKLI